MNEFTMKTKMRRYPESLRGNYSWTTIRVMRTAEGWTFAFQSGPVVTGKDGRINGEHGTGLFDMLRAELVTYPNALPDALQWLWERAAEAALTPEQVQSELQRLADWISVCEVHVPVGGAFSEYFGDE